MCHLDIVVSTQCRQRVAAMSVLVNNMETSNTMFI